MLYSRMSDCDEGYHMSDGDHSILTFRQDDVSAVEWRSFRAVLLDTIDGGVCRLVVVLDGVHIIFSGVLNALAEARTRALERGGTVVIVATEPDLHRFFGTTGFDKIFDIVDSVDEACKLIGTEAA